MLWAFAVVAANDVELGRTRLALVGVGVGNLAYDHIGRVVREAVDVHGVCTIDTAAASRNEHLIAQALSRRVTVITKVWYTHLGYNRTRLSVAQSLSKLGRVDVVALLHWPRCRHDIPWMRCEDEERELDANVRAAGPAPDHDAWRASWRALEDAYEEGSVAAIGVSNFDVDDMTEVLAMARISPHLVQINVWTVLFDPRLMELLRSHSIQVQVYNVVGGIVLRERAAPRAYADLASLGTPALLVLAWLTQNGIAVVPRSASHLADNSPAAVASVPRMDRDTALRVESAMRALMTGQDYPDGVAATFINLLAGAASVFWIHLDTGQEILVIDHLGPGSNAKLNTHHGHAFVARLVESDAAYTFQVVSRSAQHFFIGDDEVQQTEQEELRR